MAVSRVTRVLHCRYSLFLYSIKDLLGGWWRREGQVRGLAASPPFRGPAQGPPWHSLPWSSR